MFGGKSGRTHIDARFPNPRWIIMKTTSEIWQKKREIPFLLYVYTVVNILFLLLAVNRRVRKNPHCTNKKTDVVFRLPFSKKLKTLETCFSDKSFCCYLQYFICCILFSFLTAKFLYRLNSNFISNFKILYRLFCYLVFLVSNATILIDPIKKMISKDNEDKRSYWTINELFMSFLFG